MAKDKSYYFPHDYNARNDPKLQNVLLDCGCEGIGVYWCIVEMLYEQGGKLPVSSFKSIAFVLHTSEELVEKIVQQYELFFLKKNYFYSNTVNKRLQDRVEKSEKNRQNVLKRWKPQQLQQYNRNTNVVQTQYDRNTTVIPIKEKKREENKIEESIDNNLFKEEIDKSISLEKEVKKFKKPTIEEITAYCQQRANGIDAESFWNHYEAKGWKIGKSPMKNWKAAVITWEKRNKKDEPGQKDKRRSVEVSARSVEEFKTSF